MVTAYSRRGYTTSPQVHAWRLPSASRDCRERSSIMLLDYSQLKKSSNKHIDLYRHALVAATAGLLEVVTDFQVAPSQILFHEEANVRIILTCSEYPCDEYRWEPEAVERIRSAHHPNGYFVGYCRGGKPAMSRVLSGRLLKYLRPYEWDLSTAPSRTCFIGRLGR